MNSDFLFLNYFLAHQLQLLIHQKKLDIQNFLLIGQVLVFGFNVILKRKEFAIRFVMI